MTKLRSFTREFKLEAVRLWRESDRSASEVAIDLGISEQLLTRWHKQLSGGKNIDDVFPGNGKLVSADEELRRAHGQLSGASALALEDSDTRMSRLGRAELTLGEFQDLDESLRRLALVTPDAVRELAEDLVARPLSIAAVGTIDESTLAGLTTVSAE